MSEDESIDCLPRGDGVILTKVPLVSYPKSEGNDTLEKAYDWVRNEFEEWAEAFLEARGRSLLRSDVINKFERQGVSFHFSLVFVYVKHLLMNIL